MVVNHGRNTCTPRSHPKLDLIAPTGSNSYSKSVAKTTSLKQVQKLVAFANKDEGTARKDKHSSFGTQV